MKKVLLFTILLTCLQFFALKTFAQEETEILSAKKLFPDAKAIFLNRSEEFNISIEDNEIKGKCVVKSSIFINKETGVAHQNEFIPTNTFVEVSDINASTLVPSGKKYDKKKVEKIELKNNNGGIAFYDDQKSYNFIYPSVQQNSILNLEYLQTYHYPQFMGTFFFSSYIPSLKNELIINTDKNINIQYKVFNADGISIEFSKEEKKNGFVYKWVTKNVKDISQYDNAPNLRYYEPHIIFYITEYKINNEKKTLLSSAKELYSWYYQLQKNLNKNEDTRLKSITDSLTLGLKDEMEKVKKIFYWVQDNISYVAFEDGLGGFVPRDAALVYNRKFGDCKDMASIIYEMLRMAGVKSYITWIGSRDIPYNYADVPTPSVDNHMIVSYQDKQKKWYFLDATGKKASIDMFTSFIQGKQALVGISKDSFQIVTIPEKDTAVNQITDSVVMNLKDKLLVGKGSAKLTGYNGLNYQYRTESMNKDEKDEYFKRYFIKGNNKVKFSDMNISLANRTPLNVSYTFELPDYVRFNQDEIYINLNLDNGVGLNPIDNKRKIPFEIEHKVKQRDVSILNIPEGYKTDYIPSNSSYGNEIAGFSSNYEVKNNTIILTNDFYINTLMIQSSDFEKYNKVLSEKVKANKQVISLIKK